MGIIFCSFLYDGLLFFQWIVRTRLLGLEEKRMTDIEKKHINTLRLSGRSYREIAGLLSIKESTIKSYCSRNHLTDKDITTHTSGKDGCCQQCGAAIEQQAKRKPRQFCSDECRIKWWNAHRQLKRHKNPRTIKCSGCGALFTVYGSQNRKYCSHECYLAARFGGGEA